MRVASGQVSCRDTAAEGKNDSIWFILVDGHPVGGIFMDEYIVCYVQGCVDNRIALLINDDIIRDIVVSTHRVTSSETLNSPCKIRVTKISGEIISRSYTPSDANVAV